MPPPARSGKPAWRSRGRGAVPGQRQTLARGTLGCARQPPLLPPIAKPPGAAPKPEPRRLAGTWPGTGGTAAAGKENFPPVLRRAQNGRKTSARSQPAGGGAAERPERGAAGPGADREVGPDSEPGSEGSGSEEEEPGSRDRILEWLQEVNLCLFRAHDPRAWGPPTRADRELDTSIKIVYQEE